VSGPPAVVRKVAVVGTGVIGSGWAALFIAKGYTVVAYVRTDRSKAKFLDALKMTWGHMVARGIASEPEGWTAVSCVSNLSECVADADYVQESVPEDLHLKQCIIEEIDEYAPPNVIVGSSTSYIPLSLVRARAKRHPERIATAHPSLPHWDAFAEVLGSSNTITKWLADLYGKGTDEITGLGMDVVFMKKECHGHVFNVFFEATWLVSVSLAKTGVAAAHDIDKALVHFARCIIAGNGLSGMMTGLVGGGKVEATTDLVTHIAMGLPMGWNAVLISRIAPRALVWPLIWLTQRLWLPFRLLKGFVNRVVIGLNEPFGNCFDESPTGVRSFNESALQRVCALEAAAPYVEPVVVDKDATLKPSTRISTRMPLPRRFALAMAVFCFILHALRRASKRA